MSRRPAKFTQADVARALRAAKQEGLNMVVEMSPDGTIRLVPAELASGKLAPRKEIIL